MIVAHTCDRGARYAQQLLEWEATWLQSREIEIGRQGRHIKSHSLLNDEGVRICVREYCAGIKSKRNCLNNIFYLLLLIK